MSAQIGRKRIPVAIAFFALGWFVIISASFAPLAPEGIFAGQLTLGGGEIVPVNSLMFLGIALVGVGIIIFAGFRNNKRKK